MLRPSMRFPTTSCLATAFLLCLLAACEKKPDTTKPSTSEPGPAPEGMVLIPGGTFSMGTDPQAASTQPVRSGAPEFPVHRVVLEPFWMDETEVTNAQFKKFIDATGYKTQSEKAFSPEDYPDAPPGSLDPASFIFKKPSGDVDVATADHMAWWNLVKGADWNHPEGPDSNIDDRMDHPVVNLSYADCKAYADWVGKRLPTEAEWEYASRGGAEGNLYPWGNELNPDGKYLANTWQGTFPNKNTNEDTFLGTSPVKSFPPNGYGLYDIAGNVWEIVADAYDEKYYGSSPKYNPTGPTDAKDMEGTTDIKQRIIRGGSFLCSEGYCTGYRSGARQLSDDITASNHTGFRCAKTP